MATKTTKFKTSEAAREVVVESTMRSLHLMGKGHPAQAFRVRNVRVAGVGLSSYWYKGEYTVCLSTGEFTFCVDLLFGDGAGEWITLKVWAPFEKVIGVTARDFVKPPRCG